MMSDNLSFLHSTSSNQTHKQTINPTSYPIEIYITLTPNGFVPNGLTITKGTRITWINKSGQDATIQPTTTIDDFVKNTFGDNSTVSFVFQHSGRIDYINGKNSTQHGLLVVE